MNIQEQDEYRNAFNGPAEDAPEGESDDTAAAVTLNETPAEEPPAEEPAPERVRGKAKGKADAAHLSASRGGALVGQAVRPGQGRRGIGMEEDRKSVV